MKIIGAITTEIQCIRLCEIQSYNGILHPHHRHTHIIEWLNDGGDGGERKRRTNPEHQSGGGRKKDTKCNKFEFLKSLSLTHDKLC